MGLLDNVMQAPQAPQGGGGGMIGNDLLMALGLGLMSAGKNGKVDFRGILGNMMQQQNARNLNQYRNQQTQIELAKFIQDQENSKNRLALDTNKYNLDAQNAQREALTQQRKIAGAEGITQSVGVEPNVANNFQGQGMLGDLYKQKYDDFAKTGEMPGISPEERRLRLMPDILKMGDTNNALSMLPEPPKYGAPHEAIDSQGQPRLFQVDQHGNNKLIEDLRPIMKKGFSVTMPDGTTIEQGGSQVPITTDPQGNMIGAPSKATVNDLQKDVAQNVDYLNRLDALDKDYSKSYMTYLGKARGWVGEKTAKLFGESFDPEYVKGKTKFDFGINQLFNQYRKEITGAAAAIKELESLKAAMLNTDLSAEQYEAARDQFRNLIKTGLETKQKLLAQGIPYGSKEYGKQMDAVLTGNDNTDNSPQTNSSNNGIRTFNPETGKFE